MDSTPKSVKPDTRPDIKQPDIRRSDIKRADSGSPSVKSPNDRVPWSRDIVKPNRTDDRKGDFSRPIRPSDSSAVPRKSIGTRGLMGPATPPPPAPPSFREDRRRHSSSSLTVGFSGGLGFHSSHWFGHHTQVHFSFNSGLCHYDPWLSVGWNWCSPWHRRHGHWDPYWNCNPWGGFYYVRSWPCYPFTWWYPGYHVTSHYCGSWHRVQYHRPVGTYLTTFTYSDTPCAVVADCSLISPTVVVSAYDAPEFAWSSSNIQRYTLVDTVYAEAPAASVEEQLPAPATEAELAPTTERELADTYMKLGDLDSALRVYSAHVARHPGDVLAVRALGVALIERGDVRSGVERVERAYRIDPSLAERYFDRELLRTPENLGEVLDRTTALAAQLDADPAAAAAWLTVAVLMQADGRTEPARTSLDRAKDAGLNARVVEAMQAAIPVS